MILYHTDTELSLNWSMKMRQIKSLKEIQKIQVDTLRYIHKICEENNLSYFLCGGSLIGAIREHGFIPWDDDMDILMSRADYERLAKTINADKSSPYKMLTCTNSIYYYYAFGKVTDTRTIWKRKGYRKTKGLGVHVDVFPYDGLPEGRKNIEKYLKRIKTYRAVIDAMETESSKKIPGYNFFTGLAAKSAAIYINFLARQYKVENSKLVACSVAGFGKKEIIRREAYADRILWDFDKEKFYVPIGYHEYLTNMFRDYMTPPSVTQRKSPHGVQAWWK